MKTFATALAALLLSTAAASAADIAIVSMHYSAEYFVPHFRLDGVIEPGDVDELASLYDRFVGCRESCSGPSAILSLNSFGGHYPAARELADLLAERRIATVIEADQTCYSACVIAFLGGSARSSEGEAIADRIIVPGAHAALAPVDYPHEALASAIMASSLDQVLGGTADQLRQEVEEGKFGVTSLLRSYLTVASSSPLDLANPEGVYLLGAHLPALDEDSEYRAPKTETALLNACAFLMAEHTRNVPIDMVDQVDPEFYIDLELPGDGEPVIGFRMAYPDDVASCGADMKVSTVTLYGPDEEGAPVVVSKPIAPFMRLDPWLPLSDLAATYSPDGTLSYGLDDRFPPSEQQPGRQAELGFKPLYEDYSRRILSNGTTMLFEQGGPGALYDAARAFMDGPAIIDRKVIETPKRYMVRGQYADTGNAVIMVAFDTGGSAITRIEPGRPWSEISPEEQAAIEGVLCNAKSFTVIFSCPTDR